MTPLPRKTRRVAAFLRLTSLAAMALVVAAGLYATFATPQLLAEWIAHFDMPLEPADVGFTARVLILAGLWFGAALMLFTLWQLARLFACYAADAALTPEATHAIRHIGIGLLALSLFGVLGNTGAGLALSINAPPGERLLVVGIGSADLGFALGGALMMLIGTVMRQAMEAARENAGFV